MPKFYHVLTQGWAFDLHINQFSQPFDYFPQFFPHHFEHNSDYPIFQLQVSFSACAHILSTLQVFTSYVAFMVTNTRVLMMQFMTPLLPSCEMLVSMWDKNNYLRFFHPHSTPFTNESTLCSPKMAFAPQSTSSLPTQYEWIYFPDLAQLEDLLSPMWFKPMKGAIVTDTPLINSSHQQLRYLDVYINKSMCFYMIVPMPLGA